MPIRDPGNAGTASDDWPRSRHVELKDNRHPISDAEASRRAVALGIALVTALALLPAIVATTLTGEWRWLFGGLGVWFALVIVISGVSTYRFGKRS